MRYPVPSGGHVWVRDTAVPILNDLREVHQIMVTSVDITDLKETQQHLDDALTKTLSGFLKICANCKSIRHDNEWQDIETYASEQMDYQGFNHGKCSKCAK